VALPVAVAHQRRQDGTVLRALSRARRSWSRMSEADLDGSWQRVGPAVVLATARGQQAAALAGAEYVPAAVAAQGLSPAAVGVVEPAMLVGIASDGRPLGSLLYGGVVTTGQALNAGVAAPVALQQGWAWLQKAVATQVADAGRVAEFTTMVATPSVGGYARMVNPGACARCVVLAGRVYRVEGFQRHPGCRCTHVPGPEDADSDIGTDPMAYFESLPTAEQLDAEYPDLTVAQRRARGLYSQEDIFTKAGAQAIRDGADLSQVVNARRGMSTAQVNVRGWPAQGRATRREVYGHQLFTTTEGITRRGQAYRSLQQAQWARDEVKDTGKRYARLRTPRLMPESIYEIADGRDDAIRLLKLHGYIR